MYSSNSVIKSRNVVYYNYIIRYINFITNQSHFPCWLYLLCKYITHERWPQFIKLLFSTHVVTSNMLSKCVYISKIYCTNVDLYFMDIICEIILGFFSYGRLYLGRGPPNICNILLFQFLTFYICMFFTFDLSPLDNTIAVALFNHLVTLLWVLAG